jgi:DNA repair exonuclease SbcCD nuclease subunit
MIKNSMKVCIAGFPFTRRIQGQFIRRVRETGILDHHADIRLLCMHQTVEGAKVGPVDFTFRRGVDVIPGADVPPGLAAVLSGHIHRSQCLRMDMSGRAISAPVIYPGSVERTAFAEQNERKGYTLLQFTPDGCEGGMLMKMQFKPLAARPMITLELPVENIPAQVLGENLRSKLAELNPDSVVRLRLQGEISDGAWQVFSASSLRLLAPASMNIELSGISYRSKDLQKKEKKDR